MPKYRALAVTAKYWEPNEDFLNQIVTAVRAKVDDGDFVVISEKAIATALNNIVDESTVQPSFNAKLIATLWMRVCWGYLFSSMFGFGCRLTRNLREYPLETGSRHKQLALQQAGLLQALMFGSEGGIDGSNLPYAYVSLPLNNGDEIADKVHQEIRNKLGKKVTVVIVDTDKTYSFRNFHFTPRPKPIKGIHANRGILAYLIGKTFSLRKRPTPLAVVGQELSVEEALKIANIADKARGPGSGTTVWKMASRFHVTVTGVTWNMLAGIKHKPIIIIRKKKPYTKTVTVTKSPSRRRSSCFKFSEATISNTFSG
jgi:F420-0:gamma-glutamyl ligase-like protein